MANYLNFFWKLKKFINFIVPGNFFLFPETGPHLFKLKEIDEQHIFSYIQNINSIIPNQEKGINIDLNDIYIKINDLFNKFFNVNVNNNIIPEIFKNRIKFNSIFNVIEKEESNEFDMFCLKLDEIEINDQKKKN